MGLVQNIPRKQGRIFTGPIASLPIAVFGPKGQPGSDVGSTVNESDPTVYKAAGDSYNQVSSTGGNKNPVGNSHNTATQRYIPQLSTMGQTQAVPQNDVPEVAPHEKGSFFSKQFQKVAATRVSGGVDKQSNTPFHPKKTPTTRPRRYPTPSGDRTQAESFSSSHTLMSKANHDLDGSRWSIIKHGAADGFVSSTDSGAQPVGQNVGSGLTGTASTANIENSADAVAGNAHSGSPDVIKWVPNPRGSQPSERGTTFPVKQNCVQKGCR